MTSETFARILCMYYVIDLLKSHSRTALRALLSNLFRGQARLHDFSKTSERFSVRPSKLFL